MQRKHIIALDTHGQDSEVVVTTGTGRLTRRERCPTTIPTLTEVIRSVRRPRERVFEEGPLADGLFRNLRDLVDEIVCVRSAAESSDRQGVRQG